MADKQVETHPVQNHYHPHRGSKAPKVVTMRAYEVYCELYGEQVAMVTGGCRGGFSAGELIAFLYARSFPKAEWRSRFDEALRGLEIGAS
jgi:hypothetical protein